MKTTEMLFYILIMLYVITVRVNSDYVSMSVYSDDLFSLDTANTIRATSRSGIIKRATLDVRSRSSAVEKTLNSLRREERAANMYYVSWDKDIESVAVDLVRNCLLESHPPVLGPHPETYRYDGITGYFRRTYDVPDQLRSAYNSSKFRRQLQRTNMRFTGCAIGDCVLPQRSGTLRAHIFVCIFAYERSSVGALKSGVACSRCSTDTVWCDHGLCRDGVQRSHTECSSLCSDCKSAASSDDCQCICYYGDATSRCGGDASALEPTCKQQQQQPYRLSMAWVACIAVSCVLVLGVVLAIGIWYCVRHNGRPGRRRVEPSRSQTTTMDEYEPGSNFTPTMYPPPYSADKPPAYTAAGDLGYTGAVGSVAAANRSEAPGPDSTAAFDNCVSTADEV